MSIKQAPQIYKDNTPYVTAGGEVIPEIEIAYHTYGKINTAGDNVIWVCHALTADSEVADWWPHTVEEGKFLDPSRYFIICANILGSCYGTTGPLTPLPASDGSRRPLYDNFPQISIRDMVHIHQRLARYLGINRVKMLIGSSLGGFQCMEWAIIEPDFAENVVLIATTPVTRPWAAAFNESQRMAIEADATYGQPCADAGSRGLAAARSIALLSYRGGCAYDATQQEKADTPTEGYPFRRRVHSYQRHQGDKLEQRFNAYSYIRLSQAVDSHDIACGRGDIADVLSNFKPRTLVVAITSDILFPPADHQPFLQIPYVRYHVIESEFGHDGFLIEHQTLDNIIKDFLNQ